MVTLTEKNEIVQVFNTDATKMFEEVKGNFDFATAMATGNVDVVKDYVKKIQNVMIANVPDSVMIPKVSLYITPTGTADDISLINITVANKISSEKKFSIQGTATATNTAQRIFDFFLSVYTMLIVDLLAEENLVVVNEKLAAAAERAGISYQIKVVTDLGNGGKKISLITDDEIVFVADNERVFNLEDIIVLINEPNEDFTEEVIDKNLTVLAEEIGRAQTPEQLVGMHGGALIAYICDISKRLKPMTLIKKVVSKNIQRVRGNKDTFAYYSEGDIFAIVAKRDGMLEVVLSPFDVNTLRKVDVDVLKKIG